MRANKSKRLFPFKIIIYIFSLILLSVLLYLLIDLSDDWLFIDNNIILGIIIVSLLIAIVLILTFFEVLSVKEYEGYFIRRTFTRRGRSYLTLNDIFENENRVKILTEILNNPGIHQNELLRVCDIKKGQLQWHLDVLLKHKIIKKELSGQYSTYFPITSSIEANDTLKILLSKSKTTSEIFDIIQKRPGISAIEISRMLNLSRNTIKYHIDKLSKENLINLVKKGRNIELYLK